MNLNLETFLDTYYTKDEPILLGCSTGPDSMFLLYQLLQTSYKNNIVACYFNHKLRTESDEEEVFLENLGKKMGFKVEIWVGDIKKIKEALYPSISIEELAREKRYLFFSALGQIYGTKKVMTAHHLDDKIETFFFNLLRGSKLTWLINMTENAGNILRPLLWLQKSEILHYLDTNHLPYRIDSTNFENDFSRNFLRNEIIPQFFKINTHFKGNLWNIFSYFESVKHHIDEEVKTFLNQYEGEYFSLADFWHQSLFLQKEIIRYVYFVQNNASTLGLSEKNIEEILKFFKGKNNKTKKEIKLLSMHKNGDLLWYHQKKDL